jgi:4,5-DOPA dioxygenase extradiol
MPVLFVGHGSPMNALSESRFSRGFTATAAQIPLPRAILAVSAHWFVPDTWFTGDDRPKTIHDFYGFPEELYRIQYPAQGEPELARRAADLVGLEASTLRLDWGLDHGAWSVLKWMYPDADIPVVQMSIDTDLDAREHLALARRLAPLRDEGVLIFASGNVTHNLGDALRRMSVGDDSAPDWSQRFDAVVAAALEARDGETLLGLWPGTDLGRQAHPTPDHWLPLIYAFGASDDRDSVRFPVEGFDLGLSMRAALFQ